MNGERVCGSARAVETALCLSAKRKARSPDAFGQNMAIDGERELFGDGQTSAESHRAENRVPAMQRSPQSNGEPLDCATRSFMEPRFGHSFANVRVHADTSAAESAHAVRARAYTIGQDIFFGKNEFVPEKESGRKLLAHELAHTIQQRDPAGAPPSLSSDSIFESSATEAASRVANGGKFCGVLPRSGIGVARQAVTPQLLSDEQLAKEIVSEMGKLKPGEQPNEWLRELLAEVQKRRGLRAAQEQQRAQQVAAEKQAAAQAAAAEREQRDRAAAVAEAEAAAVAPEPPEEEEEIPVTPMAIDPRFKVQPPPKQSAKKKPKRAPISPEMARFLPGGFPEEEFEKEEAARKQQMEEVMAAQREVFRKSYQERLYEARRDAGRALEQEDYRKLTADDVWFAATNRAPGHELFSDAEKASVYEDQNAWREKTAEESHRESQRLKAQAAYQQQLQQEQFMQNLQLAPIQAALMGTAGGLAEAVGVTGRALQLAKGAQTAYNTYAVVDSALQARAAGQAGSPTDMVGVLLPYAAGIGMMKTVGASGVTEPNPRLEAGGGTPENFENPGSPQPPAMGEGRLVPEQQGNKVVGSQTIRSSPPPPPLQSHGPAVVTDAELVAANVRDPSSLKTANPSAHLATWKRLGGQGETAPPAFRDPNGAIHVSSDHPLLQSSGVISPVRPEQKAPARPAPQPIHGAQQPAPAKSAHPIGSADTQQAPPATHDIDPHAKTGAVAPPVKPNIGPARDAPPPPAKADMGLAKTGQAPPPAYRTQAEDTLKPVAPQRPSPPPKYTPPPQAVSAEVVEKIRNQSQPTGAKKGEGSRVNYSADHEAHELAWRRLGGHDSAPPAFIYDNQVYLDPKRWPRSNP